MAQITSRIELEKWLKGKPADWAQVIAARAALRALPYGFGRRTPSEAQHRIALNLFRMLLMSWASCQNPSDDMRSAMSAARPERILIKEAYTPAHVIDAAMAACSDSYSPFHASAVLDAVDASVAVASYAAYAGHAARASKADAAAAAAADVVWANTGYDSDKLASDAEIETAIASTPLTATDLWPVGRPSKSTDAWVQASARLNALKMGFQVWVEWYNRRIEGHNAAFDIPGDTDRIEDKKIIARLADATDEDFWGKGATFVNTTLQGWIDEARERVRQSETPDEPPPPTPDAIRAIAAEIASPAVTLTDNQLDVITNTAFDGQTDTAILDEAIAVLRAVVAALLGGMPGNAPRSFAANLTIYDSELAKRDAKPFLGVLVRMEKSVSAGFHADPEMFDAGVTTNFESYFDAHLAFMTHYRRNEERETKIAQFKIDDAAASGTALTGPVDEVAKEVEALAEQGLVTEGYAQAVKEQQEINTQIALYSSSTPTTSGEPTVKVRHILQTVGFYERALAVASNAITVAKPLAALIKILKEAIEALLKFFV